MLLPAAMNSTFVYCIRNMIIIFNITWQSFINMRKIWMLQLKLTARNDH